MLCAGLATASGSWGQTRELSPAQQYQLYKPYVETAVRISYITSVDNHCKGMSAMGRTALSASLDYVHSIIPMEVLSAAYQLSRAEAQALGAADCAAEQPVQAIKIGRAMGAADALVWLLRAHAASEIINTEPWAKDLHKLGRFRPELQAMAAPARSNPAIAKDAATAARAVLVRLCFDARRSDCPTSEKPQAHEAASWLKSAARVAVYVGDFYYSGGGPGTAIPWLPEKADRWPEVYGVLFKSTATAAQWNGRGRVECRGLRYVVVPAGAESGGRTNGILYALRESGYGEVGGVALKSGPELAIDMKDVSYTSPSRRDFLGRDESRFRLCAYPGVK
jgi:hypothetical protein